MSESGKDPKQRDLNRIYYFRHDYFRGKHEKDVRAAEFVVFDIDKEKYYVPEPTWKRMARAVRRKLSFIHQFNGKTNEIEWLELPTVLTKKEEAVFLAYYDTQLNGTIRVVDKLFVIHHDNSTFHLNTTFGTLFYCVDGGECAASVEMAIYKGKTLLHIHPHDRYSSSNMKTI